MSRVCRTRCHDTSIEIYEDGRYRYEESLMCHYWKAENGEVYVKFCNDSLWINARSDTQFIKALKEAIDQWVEDALLGDDKDE